jgi:hypothetical protein
MHVSRMTRMRKDSSSSPSRSKSGAIEGDVGNGTMVPGGKGAYLRARPDGPAHRLASRRRDDHARHRPRPFSQPSTGHTISRNPSGSFNGLRSMIAEYAVRSRGCTIAPWNLF